MDQPWWRSLHVPCPVDETRGIEAIAAVKTGVASGAVKRPSDTRPDVAIIATDRPVSVAGLTTRSTAAAASCLWTRARVPGLCRAVVVNSGNANAATGRQGVDDNRAMAAAVAEVLQCEADEVLVCSTGVIGVPLPMERLLPGIAEAASRLAQSNGGSTVAEAIVTTDTCTKQAFAQRGAVSVGGVAKGSGMIHPGMATMLGFVATDASVSPEHLQELVTAATACSFNQVSVDGDMSTNDTVLLLATGQGAPLVPGSVGWDDLVVAVGAVCRSLARAIAADGEGARTLLTVSVRGGADAATARRLARAVVSSSLVKAAVHGCDPNWGRVVGALGQAGAVGLELLGLDIGDTAVMRDGAPVPFDEAPVSAAMGESELHIAIDLPGPGWGVAWGCDLSAEYVSINADYRT